MPFLSQSDICRTTNLIFHIPDCLSVSYKIEMSHLFSSFLLSTKTLSVLPKQFLITIDDIIKSIFVNISHFCKRQYRYIAIDHLFLKQNISRYKYFPILNNVSLYFRVKFLYIFVYRFPLHTIALWLDFYLGCNFVL